MDLEGMSWKLNGKWIHKLFLSVKSLKTDLVVRPDTELFNLQIHSKGIGGNLCQCYWFVRYSNCVGVPRQ